MGNIRPDVAHNIRPDVMGNIWPDVAPISGWMYLKSGRTSNSKRDGPNIRPVVLQILPDVTHVRPDIIYIRPDLNHSKKLSKNARYSFIF